MKWKGPLNLTKNYLTDVLIRSQLSLRFFAIGLHHMVTSKFNWCLLFEYLFFNDAFLLRSHQNSTQVTFFVVMPGGRQEGKINGFR